MPDPVLAQSAAFELCGGGSCGDPQVTADGKYISCAASDGCSGVGCYCQLFRRDKNAPADSPWHVVKVDDNNKAKNRPAQFDYRCICVRPILEAPAHTIDGDTYASRFVLCAMGSCSMIEVSDVTSIDPLVTTKKYKCTGNCAGSCKCNLFRLNLGGEQGVVYRPEDAKWERVAKADVAVEPAQHFYYRCFCIK